MSFKKNFLGVILAFMFIATAFASPEAATKDVVKDSKAIVELKSIIQKIDFKINELEQKSVKVRFLVNDDNEIIVLSTDNRHVDSAIKQSLNYKSLKSNDLMRNHVYVLPVSFRET